MHITRSTVGVLVRDKECPVVIWWTGVSDEECIDDAEVLAADFGAFLLDKISASL
jgi:hypothetical protein